MLSHANSSSISSVSIFRNFIIQLFPTTILWVHFVKLSIEHVSNISLVATKWFQDKILIKMNFFNLRKTQNLLTESHDVIEATWMCESSILLWLETKFLTSKSRNTLRKKSIHEHMWLIFVVPTSNYLFDIFLTFCLWKRLTYTLFMWGFTFQAP